MRHCLYCQAFLEEDPHFDDCPNPGNDFLEVNESTKATLRELAEQTIEFVANGVSHFGKLEFYKGNVQVIDDTVQESLGYLFFFDRESAEGWQTFMVETTQTTQTGQTYENTPLQLVTHWRLVPSTRPTEALQSSEPVKPITDTAIPTHLEASSLDYTARGVGQFFNSFFYNDNQMRLGQAAVFAFKDLPKELADKIFYAEDMKYVGELLWQGLFWE